MKTFTPAAHTVQSATKVVANETLGYLNLVLTHGADEHHLGGLKLESKRLHRSEPEKIWDLLCKLRDKELLGTYVSCKIVGINIPAKDSKESKLTPDEEAELSALLHQAEGTKEGIQLEQFNSVSEYKNPPFAWVKVEVTMPELVKGWSFTASSLITTGDSRALMSAVLKMHDNGVGSATVEAVDVYDLQAEEQLEVNEEMLKELGL